MCILPLACAFPIISLFNSYVGSCLNCKFITYTTPLQVCGSWGTKIWVNFVMSVAHASLLYCFCNVSVIRVVSPPGLMFYSCFFIIFFNARSMRSVGRSPRNLATRSKACSVYKCRSKSLGACPQKIWGENMLHLAQFWTPSNFEHEYPQNV